MNTDTLIRPKRKRSPASPRPRWMKGRRFSWSINILGEFITVQRAYHGHLGNRWSVVAHPSVPKLYTLDKSIDTEEAAKHEAIEVVIAMREANNRAFEAAAEEFRAHSTVESSHDG